MRVIEIGVEERLLVEAAQQDPRRFAELYENNFERVYAYVARRVPDRAAAEDVTSEVFQQALADLARFEWRGVPFIAWLLGIAAHVLASRWRQNGHVVEVPADVLDEIGVEDEIERRAVLSGLVEALPEQQRLVVVRRFVDQLSIAEIARELGRTEGAVKQLQFRALQTLRSQWRSSND